jgi:hypothetical protein
MNRRAFYFARQRYAVDVFLNDESRLAGQFGDAPDLQKF